MKKRGIPGGWRCFCITFSWNRRGPHTELPLPKVGRAPAPGSSLPVLHAQALSASWGVFGRGKSSGVREGQGMWMELGGKGGISSHARILVARNQDVPPPHPDKNARGDSWGGLAWHGLVNTSQRAFGV